MKKSSIITTFVAVFLTIILVDSLLFSLILGNDSSLMGELPTNLLAIWVFISVAALLALIFTFYNYFENLGIKQGFEKDVDNLVENRPPENEKLQAVYQRLNDMSAELQKLSAEKNMDQAEVIEAERRRISRELHDSVSQELFAATMILSSVTGEDSSNNLTEEQMLTQSRLVLKILHEAQNEMRALLLHLRPVELDGKSLMEGMTALIDELQAKISADMSVKLGDVQASSNIEDNLFRMAQEILSNALRHAKADHIDISLYERAGNITLKIVDDGIGFELSGDAKTASYGLSNLKERALLLGGDVKVISAPNQGTSVEIRIPRISENVKE